VLYFSTKYGLQLDLVSTLKESVTIVEHGI